MPAASKEAPPVRVRPADISSTVLLIHAPYPGKLRFDGLPSSLLSATAGLLQELERRGVSSGFMDPGMPSKGFDAQLDQVLREGAVRVVLISTSTAAIEETARIARRVRELCRTEVLVVVGGPHEDACDRRVAEALPEVDISIGGDAEDVLRFLVLDYLDRLQAPRDFCAAFERSLLTRASPRGEGTVTTRAWGSPFTRSFSFGATSVESFHERCDIEKSVVFDVFPGRETVPLTISRGCSYGKCTFCSEGGPGVRSQVAERFDWVTDLGERHAGSALYFQDSIFPATKAVRTQLLPRLKELAVPWGCQVYLPTLSRATVKILAAHGCTYLYTGIESGSDELLRRIGKAGMSRALIRERLAPFAEFGVRAGLSLMFGVLSDEGELLETAHSVGETSSLLLDLASSGLPIAGIYPNIQTVLPGTAVHRGLARRGIELDFYTMPRVAEFADFEDGGIGYNFMSLNHSPSPQCVELARLIVAAAVHTG